MNKQVVIFKKGQLLKDRNQINEALIKYKQQHHETKVKAPVEEKHMDKAHYHKKKSFFSKVGDFFKPVGGFFKAEGEGFKAIFGSDGTVRREALGSLKEPFNAVATLKPQQQIAFLASKQGQEALKEGVQSVKQPLNDVFSDKQIQFDTQLVKNTLHTGNKGLDAITGQVGNLENVLLHAGKIVSTGGIDTIGTSTQVIGTIGGEVAKVAPVIIKDTGKLIDVLPTIVDDLVSGIDYLIRNPLVVGGVVLFILIKK